MARKKKWPYKYLTESKKEDYERMSDDELLSEALSQDTFAKAESKNKKNSEDLKSLRQTISGHRKDWVKGNEHYFTQAKDAYDEAKESRDEEIKEDIENKTSLESGYTEAINGFKEHSSAAMSILKRRRKMSGK